MDLDEARAELGIDASATPEKARRAYLRGIKVRKPETDPEGFRRLREAYEIVTGALAQPRMEPGSEEDEEEDEAEVPPELATLATRLRDLPAETRLEERLAALREAVREHPKSLGARWWLIQELDHAGRREEILEALRQGEADGLPGFLESRAANFPESVGPEELARLETSGSPELLALAARVHLEGSRYDEAASAIGRALDRLAETENPASQPFPGWLPRGILALEAAGKSTEARALHDRLWGWLSGTGDAALIRIWGHDFFWRIAHELGTLDPRFPSGLRRAAAQAALDGDLRKAAPKMEAFAKANSCGAEEASKLLYDLPILYSCFFRPLQQIQPPPPPKPPPEPEGPWKTGLRVVLSVLFLAGAGLLFQRLGGTSAQRDQQLEEAMLAAQQAPKLQDTWADLQQICRTAVDPEPVCAPARDVLQSLAKLSCSGARRGLVDLQHALTNLGPRADPRYAPLQARLIDEESFQCGSPP